MAADQPDAAVVQPVDAPQGSSHCPHDAHVSRIIKGGTDCGPIQHYGLVHHHLGLTTGHKEKASKKSGCWRGVIWKVKGTTFLKKASGEAIRKEVQNLRGIITARKMTLTNYTKYPVLPSTQEKMGLGQTRDGDFLEMQQSKRREGAPDLSLALQASSPGGTPLTAPISHSRSQRVLLPVNRRFPRHSSTPSPRKTKKRIKHATRLCR